MGVSKKGKRKIIVNNRVFYWDIGESDDYYGMYHINIVSEDKKFIVSYMLDQECLKEPYIIVKGKEFKSYNVGGCWKRFSSPKWDCKVVTPKIVAEIIQWCFNEEKTYMVDYKGNYINLKK